MGKIFYFDMDGVLADFRAGVDRAGLAYVGPETEDRQADDAMWDGIRGMGHFYRTLPPVQAGLDLFRELKSAGADCRVLTAVPKPVHRIAHAAADKRAWCGEYLGDDVQVNICTREEKPAFCTGRDCVLIDDQNRNVRDWERAGGTGILFDGAPGAARTALGLAKPAAVRRLDQAVREMDGGGPGPLEAGLEPG